MGIDTLYSYCQKAKRPLWRKVFGTSSQASEAVAWISIFLLYSIFLVEPVTTNCFVSVHLHNPTIHSLAVKQYRVFLVNSHKGVESLEKRAEQVDSTLNILRAG